MKKQQGEFISVEEAARILQLAPKTVYNRKGGTAGLLRIKQGRLVQLLRSDVENHKANLIATAVSNQNRILGEVA